MLLIPVIDIRGGQVVRGVAGQREQYKPLASGLCASADPADVTDSFLDLYPFSVLYIADLDAIEGRAANAAISIDLVKRFPALRIWLDAGFKSANDLRSHRHPQVRPVLGSESQRSLGGFRRLRNAAGSNPVLSVDFKNDSFLGPSDLLRDPSEWPKHIIVMDLDRVGSRHGPATERIAELQRTAPDKCFYAAGGARDRSDIENLAATGCHGLLLASALHDGRLDRHDIAALMSPEDASGLDTTSARPPD